MEGREKNGLEMDLEKTLNQFKEIMENRIENTVRGLNL